MKKYSLKIISAMLAVMMTCLCLVVPTVAETSWDGSKATSLSGSGTQSDPYLIANASDLALVSEKVNAADAAYVSAYYKLTADIYMNDTTDIGSWGPEVQGVNNWTPIGSSPDNPFKGHFDGDGHTIYGMYVYMNELSGPLYGGLFGYILGSTSNRTSVKNLTIAQSYISLYNENTGYGTGWVQVGGIAGHAQYIDISNCAVDATIMGDGINSRDNGACGGILGRALGFTITNCVNVGSLSYRGGVIDEQGTANNRIGGIVGVAANGTIDSCYNAGNVSGIRGTGRVGGIIGRLGFGGSPNVNISNCYNTGTLSAEYAYAMVGGIVGTLRAGGSTFTNCFNLGNIVAAIQYGEIFGDIDGNEYTLTNCYYDSDIEDLDMLLLEGATGISELVSENMTGFDASVWNLTNGQSPTLKNAPKLGSFALLGAKIREAYTVCYKDGQKVAEGQGLCFGARLSLASYLDSDGLADGYSVGIIISKVNTETPVNLTYENAEYKMDAGKFLTYDATTESVEFFGYFIGLDADNFDTEYVAKAYVMKDGAIVMYSNSLTRSVNGVAEALGGSVDENGNFEE